MNRRWKKCINALLPVVLGFSFAAKCLGVDQAIQGRLDAAIAALRDKKDYVQNTQFLKTHLQQLANNLRLFRSLQNLNLTAIGLELRRSITQSIFTENRITYNRTVASSNTQFPRNPFTVNSGKSGNDITQAQNRATVIIPIHSSVNTEQAEQAEYLSLGAYNTQGLNIARADSAAMAEHYDQWIPTNRSVNIVVGRLTNQQKGNILRALVYTQANFSQSITIRKLLPGELLVRCCQKGSREPGSWWVKVQDMPTSIQDVREGMAIRPDWNQDGNLEFFIVPEGCDIIVLEGPAAAQILAQRIATNPNAIYQFIKLNPGEHFAPQNLQNPQDPRANVTGQYLAGGTNQIFITGNINGIAFQHYMPCIVIFRTSFDVEL